VFVAAVLTGAQQAAIVRVLRWQLTAGAVALLLGLVLAWLTAGRVLRPVRDTTDLARRITETDLSGRIPVRGRHEAAELAVTFNRMLDRLESAVTAQRHFLADAGHELRTPITIIQGNLDTITAAGEDAEALAIAADELARMTRLVDELLLLASSERPDFLHVQAADLDAMTRSLAAKARGLDSRAWVLTAAAPGTALLDPQRMTQGVMQLAANAAAHTPAGTPVEIWSASDGTTVEFAVADHGPGVPATDRDRIFRRFARLDARRTSGTGLGLSIVAAIAAAHGGQVRITDTAGGGATFSIVIPLRRPAGVPGTAVRAPGAGPADPPDSPAAPDQLRKALA
jgi:signal transduction histidine kinase